MSVGDIVVKLNLDDSRFTGKLVLAEKELSKLRTALGGTATGLDRNARSAKGFGRGLRDAIIGMGLIDSALRNLNNALFGHVTKIIMVNSELEKMQVLMAGLSDASGGYAEANEEAAKSVDKLFQMSSNSPFDVSAITDSFVKMKTSGLDPLEGGLSALTNSVAKFGGTSQQLKRASIAIQQMVGKGVISMEELRQQLGEAVPNAMPIMARAMDMSMRDLVDKISTGTVDATSALQRMFQQMNLENEGAAVIMSNTFEGLLNKTKNSFTMMAKDMGDAGLFNTVKDQLKDLNTAISSNMEFKQAAIELAEALEYIVIQGAELVKFLARNKEFIGTLITSYVALKVGTMALGAANKSLAVTFAASSLSMQKFYTNLVIVGRGSAATSASLNLLGRAAVVASAGVATLTVTMLNLVKSFAPLAVITAAVWALSEAYDYFIGNHEKLKKLTGSDFEQAAFFTDEQIEDLKEANVESAEAIRLAELYEKYINQDVRKNNPFRGTEYTEAKEAFANLALLREAHNKRTLLLKKAETAILERAINDQVTMQLETMAKAEAPIRAQYTKAVEAMREGILAGEGTAEEKQAKIAAERARLTANLRVEIEQIYADAQERLRESGEDLGGDKESLLLLQAKAGAVAVLDEQLQSLIKTSFSAPVEAKFLDKDSTELTKAASALESYQRRLAKLQGGLTNTNPFLEELNIRLKDGGSLAGSTAEETAKLVKVVDDLWKATQKKDEEKQLEKWDKGIDRISASLTKLNAQYTTDNPYTKIQNGTRQYTEQLISLKNEIDAIAVKSPAMIEMLTRVNNLINLSDQTGVEKVLDHMRLKSEEINFSMLTGQARLNAEYAKTVAEVTKWVETQDKLNPDQIKIVENYLDSLNQKLADQTPLNQWVNQWKDTSDEFNNLWASSMTRFSDTLADGLASGKLSFGDFAKFVLKEILKIMVAKMIAGMLGGMMGGGTGGGATPSYDHTNADGFSNAFLTSSAKGNIVGPGGAVALRKYSKGGIAKSPQLSLFGEGDSPEAYVPLPDGRSIPVTMKSPGATVVPAPVVHFNLINQSGGDVESKEESEPRFDGDKYVVDVVLRAMNRPGPLRESMKGIK